MIIDLGNEERILKLINSTFEPITPKEVALYTGIKQETTRGLFRKLYKEGKVKLYKNLRGYYIPVDKTSHGIFDYKFQNCVLTSNIIGYKGNIKPISNSLYEIIKTRLIFSEKTEKATMHVSSEYCIDIAALLTVIRNFKYAIKEHTRMEVSLDNVTISTVEFNKDYYNLRLDGPNCITLSSLIDQYKIYQKPEKIREEFKLKYPIPFPVIKQLLTSTSYQADLMNESYKNRKELEEIRKCMISLNNKVGKLFEIVLRGKNDNSI